MIPESNSVELDLAGFTDENGNVGGRVPAGYVIVPEGIELDGDVLAWDLTSGDPMTKPKTVCPDHETLNDFLQLAEAPSDAFLRFARKWGVLNLDHRGRPCTRPLHFHGREPIEEWRYFSKRAAAVLQVAAHLKQGKDAPAETWNYFLLSENGSPEQFNALTKYWLPAHHFVPPKSKGRAEYIARERRIIASELNAWLAMNNEQSNLRRQPDFQVHWNEETEGWELRIDYDGFLFRALAFQLTLAACGARALYSCSGCGTPYLRTRHAPRRSKANFCEQCGRTAINRRAAQRRRQKIAKALRLYSKGVPIKAIAARLDTKPQSVKNWIKKETSK